MALPELTTAADILAALTLTGESADVELAYAYLKNKQEPYNVLWAYYSGEHPLVYNASKLRDIFKDINANFSENWSAVVVNTILDRIAIERFQIGDGKDEAQGKALAKLWRSTELDQDAYDAHLCALVTGEAFIICGEDADGNIEAFYNDSRLCHMVYEESNPHKPRFAAKWWEETVEGKIVTHLTLYYADKFEYYTAKGERKNLTGGTSFILDDTAPNPYDEIPVYHIRRERRGVVSELADIIPLQAQLNKTLADMMIASEFGAFKQRWVIAAFVGEGTRMPKLKNIPNEIWTIPGGAEGDQPTQVGEFAATELKNYLEAIDRAANVIATIAGIPKALLFSTGDIPSGAALRALEAPLVKKAKRYFGRWESPWRRVLRWMMLVSGMGKVTTDDIDVIWAEPATTQPEEDAKTAESWVKAGVPIKTVLRWQGKSEAEIEQMEEDAAEEQERAATLAQAFMKEAETNASRNGGNFGGNGNPSGNGNRQRKPVS